MDYIYKLLGFEPLGKLVFPNEVLERAKDLFSSFPLKQVALKPLLVERNLFDESFAISTAEDSELAEQEAQKIDLSPEVEARLAKYREDTTLTRKQKYDRLEFENVQSVETKIDGIAFGVLSPEILKSLHYDLTIGLDEYAQVSPYHPGEFRRADDIRVGKWMPYTPPPFAKIGDLLGALFNDFVVRPAIHLPDLLEFHFLLYAIHPFGNGNKRVSRILESMLLRHYGYSADRTLSLSAYYGRNRADAVFFMMQSLLGKDPTPFVNFALRGYLAAGETLYDETVKLLLKEFIQRYDPLLELTFSEKRKAHYRAAGKAILNLNGVFTHGDFVARMKRQGHTLGVSQEILKGLKQQGILLHEGNLYHIRGALELREQRQRLLRFQLENGA